MAAKWLRELAARDGARANLLPPQTCLCPLRRDLGGRHGDCKPVAKQGGGGTAVGERGERPFELRHPWRRCRVRVRSSAGSCKLDVLFVDSQGRCKLTGAARAEVAVRPPPPLAGSPPQLQAQEHQSKGGDFMPQGWIARDSFCKYLECAAHARSRSAPCASAIASPHSTLPTRQRDVVRSKSEQSRSLIAPSPSPPVSTSSQYHVEDAPEAQPNAHSRERQWDGARDDRIMWACATQAQK